MKRKEEHTKPKLKAKNILLNRRKEGKKGRSEKGEAGTCTLVDVVRYTLNITLYSSRNASLCASAVAACLASVGLLYVRSSKDEHTTLTDDMAMAAPCSHGHSYADGHGRETLPRP